MNFATFMQEIRTVERSVAPGGRTGLWGDFVDRMMQLDLDPFQPDGEINDGEAAWWLGAYIRVATLLEDGLDFPSLPDVGRDWIDLTMTRTPEIEGMAEEGFRWAVGNL